MIRNTPLLLFDIEYNVLHTAFVLLPLLIKTALTVD